MTGHYRFSKLPKILFMLSVGLGFSVLLVVAASGSLTLADTPRDFVHSPMLQAEAENDFFVTAAVCGQCHTGIQDKAGTDISFDTAWRSSVMANASNDPYWLASVRRELLANPAELAPVIEDTCATCHMPMARFTARVEESPSLVLGEAGFNNPENDLHVFAIEGVSCTVCHQIAGDNFGEHESFDGGYIIDDQTLLGERLLYGTFEIGSVRKMEMGSGFIAVQGKHLSESEMCATCHNLTTPYLDDNNEIAGTMPEQMPYTEWENSAYNDEQSCVDCHMLRAEGEAFMVNDGGEPRANLARHHTTGGNNYLLRMLMEHNLGENIGATPAEYQAAIDINPEFLRNKTAEMLIENAAVENGELNVDVVITNLAGHKLPTSFPSRRVWIHFTVTDSAGNIVFESGGYTDDGSILGNNNDLDAASYEPHFTEVTSEDEVQIYEAIMVTTSDVPTTTLLRGARFVKDNRILPVGFDKNVVPGDIQVQGSAQEDINFTGGGDTVHYRIDLKDAQGPYTISAALLYQSLSYRWAADMNTFVSDTAPEISAFLDLYAQVPNLPELITEANFTIEG